MLYNLSHTHPEAILLINFLEIDFFVVIIVVLVTKGEKSSFVNFLSASFFYLWFPKNNFPGISREFHTQKINQKWPKLYFSHSRSLPFALICPFRSILQNWLSCSLCSHGPGFPGAAPTDPHRGPHGVVQTAHVVHLGALGRVVQDGGGKEPEVLYRPGNVHGSCQGYGFPCENSQQQKAQSVYLAMDSGDSTTHISHSPSGASVPSSLGQTFTDCTEHRLWFNKTMK